MDSKLCEDMVKIEILSRVSLKTLDLIRCTNKELAKFTYEAYLLDLYKQRNSVVSGFLDTKPKTYINEFSPSHGSTTIDLGFLPRNSRILASSEQGIMVFESPNPRTHKLISYYVCKPATKQVVALPNPKTRYFTEKVAIVVVGSKPLHYKIIRLSSCKVLKKRGEIYMTYRCEIFDSRTWGWKLLDLLRLPFCVFLTNPQPIVTGGSIFMLLTNNDILKFDAYSENWRMVSLPTSTVECESRQLMKHEGRLGFVCKDLDGCWEIWVLGVEERWEKIHVFNEEEDVKVRKSFDDPNTSITLDIYTFLFYNGNSSISKVEFSERCYELFVFRSDFEPTNLRGREK